MSLCFLSGKVARVLKMLVIFPSFLGFVGWFLLVYLGLEGFGVFCVPCFCFSFWFWFCFCLFALFCFVVGCCCFCFCFCFFCLFFCFVFVFFGGFKGQVRYPKGPPHLALNPPYFLVVCLVFVVFFCFLQGLRVR